MPTTFEPVELSKGAEHVLQEIVDTERDYVRDMTFLHQQFFIPIQGNSTFISDADYSKLISSLEMILSVNRTFLKELEPNPQALGSVICAHTTAILKSYSRYAAENYQALATLKRLKVENQHFTVHCSKFEKRKEANHNDMEAYLVKPIQRICKYPLLLDQLLGQVPASFPDRINLQRACQKMRDITNDINEMKRFSENLHALQSVQERVQGIPPSFKLIISTRYFIQEDTLIKVSKGKAQSRHFWLFNDLLLYAKTQSGVLRFAGRVLLFQIMVRDLPDTPSRQFAFEIDRRDKKKKTYIIIAPDQRTKQKWFKTILELLAQQNNIQASSRLSVRLKLRETVKIEPGMLPR